MLINNTVEKTISGILLIAILFFTPGCNQFVYLPKSAKQKYFARPHIQFMMAVIEFRESTGGWPASQFELQNQKAANGKIINDFQYRNLYFQAKKDDRLFIFFDDYKKELYLDVPDKTDLNRLRGVIRFYKSGDKFLWKVKMQ